MRHTLGLLLGFLLTPALAYGSAWGYEQAGASFDAIDQTIGDRTRMLGSFALLAAVGLVMGIVVLARWASPFVSLIPALAFIGWTVYFLAAPGSALSLPGHLPPAGRLDTGLRVLLGYGVFGLFGCALLVPAWAPGRWGATRVPAGGGHRADGGGHRGEDPGPRTGEGYFEGGDLPVESPRAARRRREFNAFD